MTWPLAFWTFVQFKWQPNTKLVLAVSPPVIHLAQHSALLLLWYLHCCRALHHVNAELSMWSPHSYCEAAIGLLTWCLIAQHLLCLLHCLLHSFRRLHELEQGPGQHCSCGLMPRNQHGHQVIPQLLVINVCIPQIYHETQQTGVFDLQQKLGS